MTSQAKIQSNRRNAEKSTGPKTEEGKAVVSQNAVTHGLTSRYDVLSCEDPAEYRQHRQTILEEFNPAGAYEAMLVERIVSFSWRARRADRLQAAVIEYLSADEQENEMNHEVYDDDPPDYDPDEVKEEPSRSPMNRMGRCMMRDSAKGGVVERLSLYEQRLENSYHRAVAELFRRRKMKREEGTGARAGLKPAPTTDGKTKPNDRLEAVDRRPEEPTEPGEKTNPNSSEEPAGSVPARASKEMPCGVATNGQTALAQVRTQESGPSSGPDESAKQSQTEARVETQDSASSSLPTGEIASLRSQ